MKSGRSMLRGLFRAKVQRFSRIWCLNGLYPAINNTFQRYRFMGRVERQRELARRRKRRVQLKKIRAKHAAASTDAEKAELLAKARRMSPFVELESKES